MAVALLLSLASPAALLPIPAALNASWPPSLSLTLPHLPHLPHLPRRSQVRIHLATTGRRALDDAHERLRPIRRLRAMQRVAAQPLVLTEVPTVGSTAAGTARNTIDSITRAVGTIGSSLRLPSNAIEGRITASVDSLRSPSYLLNGIIGRVSRGTDRITAAPIHMSAATASAIAASSAAICNLFRRDERGAPPLGHSRRFAAARLLGSASCALMSAACALGSSAALALCAALAAVEAAAGAAKVRERGEGGGGVERIATHFSHTHSPISPGSHRLDCYLHSCILYVNPDSPISHRS